MTDPDAEADTQPAPPSPFTSEWQICPRCFRERRPAETIGWDYPCECAPAQRVAELASACDETKRIRVEIGLDD